MLTDKQKRYVRLDEISKPLDLEHLKATLILKGLTPIEATIATLATDNLCNAEIKERLVLLGDDVRFHLRHILIKLKLKSRAQLIVFCLRF